MVLTMGSTLLVENQTTEQVKHVPIMTPGSLDAVVICAQQDLLRTLHLAQQFNLDQLVAFVYWK